MITGTSAAFWSRASGTSRSRAFRKLLTGMTRDGTFLVENGKIQRGIRNFRFNESLLHMLSNVEAMSLPAEPAAKSRSTWLSRDESARF